MTFSSQTTGVKSTITTLVHAHVHATHDYLASSCPLHDTHGSLHTICSLADSSALIHTFSDNVSPQSTRAHIEDDAIFILTRSVTCVFPSTGSLMCFLVSSARVFSSPRSSPSPSRSHVRTATGDRKSSRRAMPRICILAKGRVAHSRWVTIRFAHAEDVRLVAIAFIFFWGSLGATF